MEVSRVVYPIFKIMILLGLIGFVVAFVYGGFILFSSGESSELLKHMSNLKFIILCSVVLIHIPIIFFVGYVVLKALFGK